MASSEDSLSDITILQDASTLSMEDLLEEYDKVASNYSKAKKIVDTYRQKLYQLERQHKLSLNLEEDYKHELQNIADAHASELDKQKTKSQEELVELRRRLEQLKSEVDQLETENGELKSAASQALVTPVIETKPCDPNETIVATSRLETLIELEAKYASVTEDNAMLKAKNSELLANAARTEVNIHCRVSCVAGIQSLFSRSFFHWIDITR